MNRTMLTSHMKKAAIGLILLLILAQGARSQGARFDGVAQRTIQNFLAPIPGALITVCSAAGTGTPCTPLASIFLDSGLTQPASNPFFADSNGNFGWWAAASTTYKYSITATGVTGQLFTVVLPIVGGGASTFTTFSSCTQNGAFVVGSSCYATIQAAITAAGTTGSVLIPRSYAGTDSYTSPATVPILDQRTTTFLNITPALSVDSTISTIRPVKDNTGAVVPLGGDLALEGDGAADVSETNNDITLISSTNVAAPGIATILVSASFTITCNGVSSSTNPTACLYPGNVGHSGAPIAVDACYIPINGPSCNNGADEENLNPSTAACGSLAASTFAIVDATHICANFAKAHTSLPYTLSQRGAFIIRAYTVFTTDTDATPMFVIRHFGTTAAHGNRDFGISRGSGPNDYIIKSGDGAGNHFHRMFGNTSGTGTTLQFVQGNCGFSPCGTGTNNTAASHIDFIDNETDQTLLFRVDGIGQQFSRNGYFCTVAAGCQAGASSTPLASIFFGPSAANNWGFKGTGTTGNSTITWLSAAVVTPTWTVVSTSGTPAVNAAGDSVYGTYRVTADQTITAGASLTNIPGLTWTMPVNTALNVAFHCEGSYNETTAATSMQFGIQDVTIAPTNIYTKKVAWTSISAASSDNTPTLTTTTATGIGAAFTPSAATTVFNFTLDGMIEQPSNASSSAINIMAQFTTNNGVIKRGSYCQVF